MLPSSVLHVTALYQPSLTLHPPTPPTPVTKCCSDFHVTDCNQASLLPLKCIHSPSPVTTLSTHPTHVPNCEWILDSGVFDSMARDNGGFLNYLPFKVPRKVHFGNGSVGLALGQDQMKLATLEGNLMLE